MTKEELCNWVSGAVLKALRDCDRARNFGGSSIPVSVLDIEIELSSPRPADGPIAYAFAHEIGQRARWEAILWALKEAVKGGHAIRVRADGYDMADQLFRPASLLEAITEAAAESTTHD